MSQFNRRNFLSGLGASALFLSAPEKLLMGNILDGVFNKVNAATSGVSDKILINISLNNAPARWYYDLPLRPNGDDQMVDNLMATNRFSIENGVIRPVVATHQVGNFHLPYLWKANIPVPSGGWVPMANLAQSAVFIRGYDLVSDGHELNRVKHNAPIVGSASLSGVFADNSNKPFPAVTDTATFMHKSELKNMVSVPAGYNPFYNLMEPFIMYNQRSFNRRQAMDNAIKEVQNNMSALFGRKNPYAAGLAGERDNAIELFSKGAAGLQEKYNVLYAKYRALETRCYGSALLEGIDDRPLMTDANNPMFRIGSAGDIIPTSTSADLRNLVTTNMSGGSMAAGFAIAEYIATEKLSSSLLIGMQDIGGLDFGSVPYIQSNGNAFTRTSGPTAFDAHYTGAIPGTLIFSKFYQAFAACLYELTLRLKEKNLYNDTIIQISGDFNRSANASGAGSDHGYAGSAMSLYSGMFDDGTGPLVVGNVSNNPNGGGKKGSWGVAAAVPEMNNRVMGIGNIMSTITSGLCGYKSMTPNDAPMLKMVNGKLVNMAGRPKNV